MAVLFRGKVSAVFRRPAYIYKMNSSKISFRRSLSLVMSAWLALCSLFVSSTASAHGSVALSDDLCLINIDFLESHFTVFQPDSRGTEEYCEDIPDVTRSIFVMEYLHNLLPEMMVDFRIIRDVEKLGRYASWEDVQQMEDLEAVTVFYQEPVIEPGGFLRASHTFDEAGTYIGIVTAEHPVEDRYYNAVFYFQVGGADLGSIPLFIALVILLQLGYWLSNGGWAKVQKAQKLRKDHNKPA